MIAALDPTELTDFTAAALGFLEANAKRRSPPREVRWGEGPDEIGVLEVHAGPDEEIQALEAAKAWRATVFDAGFGWLGGPVAYGGAGRNPALDEIYRALEAEFDVPNQNVLHSGISLVAPAILAHGSDHLKARYLSHVFRGDLVCCQLLSEPGAGSDLAALAARAEPDGDEWVVSGQKVWTSYAHLADLAQLLVRTAPDAPKHHGLTMFVLDTHRPGVEVRPLRQMTGEVHFNEVFLDGVRIPDADRIGELGEGWQATLTTLMAERAAVGSGATNPVVNPLRRLRQLAEHLDSGANPLLRQSLADVYIHEEVLRFMRLRRERSLAAGKAPGPEGSLLKLLDSRQTQRIGAMAGALLGAAMAADTGAWGTFAWANYVCGAPLKRIAGGTDEIQRNTLAERVLGLPREPREAWNPR